MTNEDYQNKYQSKEYLESRIKWFWKYRQPYINRLSTDEEKDDYHNKMQELINENVNSYEGNYKIEYCQYCYMPLFKGSVSAKHGHCGYSCP